MKSNIICCHECGEEAVARYCQTECPYNRAPEAECEEEDEDGEEAGLSGD